ncbi:hypothetical protein LT493_43685 [Streptomyces tricolor]|nr:hypothetical protein [Streptomyces tricolor]
MDRADVAELSRALGVDTDDPLTAVVPALARRRRLLREQSAVDGWRYTVTWERLAVPDDARPTGPWLLVVPAARADDPLAAHVAAALTAHGAEVGTLTLGADDTDRAALADRLAGHRPAGVLSLLALDDAPHPGHPALPTGLALTVALVQALGDAGVTAPLWCATRGAVATGPADRVTAPAQAQTWGLGRVVALEHPERWGGLIDLPAEWDERAAGRLAALLAGGGDEDQTALRATGVCARRLTRAPLGAGPAPRPLAAGRHRPAHRRHRSPRTAPGALAGRAGRRAHRAARPPRRRRPDRGRTDRRTGRHRNRTALPGARRHRPRRSGRAGRRTRRGRHPGAQRPARRHRPRTAPAGRHPRRHVRRPDRRQGAGRPPPRRPVRRPRPGRLRAVLLRSPASGAADCTPPTPPPTPTSTPSPRTAAPAA